MGDDSGLIFGRPNGESSWNHPSRDILMLEPSFIIRGAAYAVDPNSSIRHWLVRQEGIREDNVVEKVRTCLKELLKVLEEARHAPLNEVLVESRFDWPALQAVMFGLGIVSMNTYNRMFREARFTEVKTGRVEEPTKLIDNERAIRLFESLVSKAYGHE